METGQSWVWALLPSPQWKRSPTFSGGIIRSLHSPRLPTVHTISTQCLVWQLVSVSLQLPPPLFRRHLQERPLLTSPTCCWNYNGVVRRASAIDQGDEWLRLMWEGWIMGNMEGPPTVTIYLYTSLQNSLWELHRQSLLYLSQRTMLGKPLVK